MGINFSVLKNSLLSGHSKIDVGVVSINVIICLNQCLLKPKVCLFKPNGCLFGGVCELGYSLEHIYGFLPNHSIFEFPTRSAALCIFEHKKKIFSSIMGPSKVFYGINSILTYCCY